MQRADKTGAPGIVDLIPEPSTRKQMQLMADLYEGSVEVKPRLTISAGAKADYRRDNVSSPPPSPHLKCLT